MKSELVLNVVALQVPCLKLCSLQEVSHSNCVYRNVVDHAAREFTQVLFEDVASDPTLPRTKSVRCAACGHGEAVFFQVSTMCDACLLQFVQSFIVPA